MKPLYHFGPFALDPNKRALSRRGKPVALIPKAFDVLLYLAQNPNRVISKEELLKGVWAGNFVEEGNLTQNVFLLRKVLAEESGENSLIVTVPRVGYQFAAEVAIVTDTALVPPSPPGNLVLGGVQSTTHIVIEEEIDSDSGSSALPSSHLKALPAPASSGKRRWYVLALAVVALTAAVVFRPVLPPPTVTRIRQLTHLGTLVHNTKLLTDGPRIYFRAWDGKDRVLRYVSPEGGEVFSVDSPFPQIDINDLSPSGSEFLVVNLADRRRTSYSDDDLPSVWRIAVPSGSPRPVGDLRARESSWSPDGRTIACAMGSDIYLVDPDGSNARKLASLPGEPFYLLWSPDSKRLRFSVADPHRNATILWQVDLASKVVAPVLPDSMDSTGVLPGGWTPDGRYFLYTASGDGTRNVWAIRETKDPIHRVNPTPVPITAGPLTFYLPSSSKDGKSVFVVGEQLRGELMRYDATAHQFVPYAKGISGDQVTFSRDGQWMAYVDFPSSALVRSRLDGSARRQLTFPPMRALNPQWSPDGTQIAFQASAQTGAHPQIYLIPSSGGLPVVATPEGAVRQIYPSWASDGNSILFSGSNEARSDRALYNVDLKTKRVSRFSGSESLYWGQVSPDGQHIVALEDTTQRLILYDVATHKTRSLADLADYPRWSSDGQYVYFSTMYFSGPGKNGGVYRWKLSTNTIETVMKYPDFLLTGSFGVTFGVTPDGEILALRDLSTHDLYALDVELP
ncbi:MAG TPA: winged helix-turn-helix domain-containing protein [Candidatus Sulfotelmatobacter sp.]